MNRIHASIGWACLLGLASQAAAGPRFPFPRAADYPYGIRATTSPRVATADGSEIQALFETWKRNFLDSNETLLRVKFDPPTETVSEGIGTAMLLMVLMDNAKNNTRPQFDKLWAFYNFNLDGHGLMNWQVKGFTGQVVLGGSATDADQDAALALILASRQWPDGDYLAQARSLVHKIQVELGLAGDMGSSIDVRLPGYFSPSILRLFHQAVDQPSSPFTRAVDDGYSSIQWALNGSTGLVPDQTDHNGTPKPGHSDFGSDAIRTPWRLGIDYSWNGETRARTLDSLMASWTQRTPILGDPARVVAGFQTDGRPTSTSYSPAFVGGLGSAGLVDTTFQRWVDTSYSLLKSTPGTAHVYDMSLALLSLLYMSGNFNNLWDTAALAAATGVSWKINDFDRASRAPNGIEGWTGATGTGSEASISRIAGSLGTPGSCARLRYTLEGTGYPGAGAGFYAPNRRTMDLRKGSLTFVLQGELPSAVTSVRLSIESSFRVRDSAYDTAIRAGVDLGYPLESSLDGSVKRLVIPTRALRLPVWNSSNGSVVDGGSDAQKAWGRWVLAHRDSILAHAYSVKIWITGADTIQGALRTNGGTLSIDDLGLVGIAPPGLERTDRLPDLVIPAGDTGRTIPLDAVAFLGGYFSGAASYTATANPSRSGTTASVSHDTLFLRLRGAPGERDTVVVVAQGAAGTLSDTFEVRYADPPLSIRARPAARDGSIGIQPSVILARGAGSVADPSLGIEPRACSEPGSCQVLRVQLPAPAEVDVRIFDHMGTPVIGWNRVIDPRQFRSLPGTTDGRKSVTLGWNLRATTGQPVGTGVYLWKIRVRTDDGAKSETVHKLGVF